MTFNNFRPEEQGKLFLDFLAWFNELNKTNYDLVAFKLKDSKTGAECGRAWKKTI